MKYHQKVIYVLFWINVHTKQYGVLNLYKNQIIFSSDKENYRTFFDSIEAKKLLIFQIHLY